jgi:hypothetical protein
VTHEEVIIGKRIAVPPNTSNEEFEAESEEECTKSLEAKP